MPPRRQQPKTCGRLGGNRVPSASYDRFVKSMAAAILAPKTTFEKHPTLPKAAVAKAQ